jgi:hypothetical protein
MEVSREFQVLLINSCLRGWLSRATDAAPGAGNGMRADSVAGAQIIG